MTLFLGALAVLVLGGLAAAAAGRRSDLATALGAGSALLGGALGTLAVGAVLFGRVELVGAYSWGAPFGTIELGIDFLSAVFLLPAFVVPALAAIYGAGYLQPWRRERLLGVPWLSYNVLSAAMALVLAARSALVFLVAWEVMALASFLLVTFEHERLEVRRAGWTYLVATHLGTAALLVFFLLLGRASGHFDFHTALAPHAGAGEGAGAGVSAVGPGVLFLLALVGFGTKAGLAPLHVWLPDAHPAAPSHVSAVMSGVMIKTGIYGILRATTLLGAPAWWWGASLLGVGIATSLVGVLFALAQHDLKRLLAYSSVENVGIIAMGMGMGLL
ncbi:MAG TPA: proton-conducting transporter membrane subunit, partial [Longimicrobiales bacterium]